MSGPEPSSDPPRSDGLGRRFVLGSFYLGVGQWASMIFNFATTLVIARILGPADFGLYAFVFAINAFINIVGAFSLNIALIQAKEASENLFDTAFAICAVLGAIGLAGE